MCKKNSEKERERKRVRWSDKEDRSTITRSRGYGAWEKKEKIEKHASTYYEQLSLATRGNTAILSRVARLYNDNWTEQKSVQARTYAVRKILLLLFSSRTTSYINCGFLQKEKKRTTVQEEIFILPRAVFVLSFPLPVQQPQKTTKAWNREHKK